MLELRVPKGASLAAQLDELVLFDGEDELRALTHQLQDAIFRVGFPSAPFAFLGLIKLWPAQSRREHRTWGCFFWIPFL
jgi:hypothetical protein